MGPRNPGGKRTTNRSARPVSIDALRQRLVNGIKGAGVDPVPLNATSEAAADDEARARQCDFILYTDISSFKISAAKKLGGILGRATGVSGVAKSDARVDFKLFAVGEPARGYSHQLPEKREMMKQAREWKNQWKMLSSSPSLFPPSPFPSFQPVAVTSSQPQLWTRHFL